MDYNTAVVGRWTHARAPKELNFYFSIVAEYVLNYVENTLYSYCTSVLISFDFVQNFAFLYIFFN